MSFSQFPPDRLCWAGSWKPAIRSSLLPYITHIHTYIHTHTWISYIVILTTGILQIVSINHPHHTSSITSHPHDPRPMVTGYNTLFHQHHTHDSRTRILKQNLALAVPTTDPSHPSEPRPHMIDPDSTGGHTIHGYYK